MITSDSNPKLRYVQHLSRRAFRQREGRMLLEGLRLVEAALDAGHRPAFSLASDLLDASARGAALRSRLIEAGAPPIPVADALLRQVGDTQHGQGLLAVLPIPELPLPDRPSLLLLLDGLRDPGNLGTALRSADAAGVDVVLLSPGTVDWSNAKVVRAAMGAHFHVPVRQLSWAGIDSLLAELEPRPSLWLAEAGGRLAHSEVDWRAPSLLVIGGEAAGPSAEARARATDSLRIRMPGRAESLNAAGAAAVILFEALRQRAEA